MSQVISSASLADKIRYFKICFLFFWTALQNLMWLRTSSLKLGQY